MGVERNREVQAATHSIEPPPIGQVSDETSGSCQTDVERSSRIVGRERLREGAVQPLDIPTILGSETTC
jgi:hypothetical protein